MELSCRWREVWRDRFHGGQGVRNRIRSGFPGAGPHVQVGSYTWFSPRPSLPSHLLAIRINPDPKQHSSSRERCPPKPNRPFSRPQQRQTHTQSRRWTPRQPARQSASRSCGSCRAPSRPCSPSALPSSRLASTRRTRTLDRRRACGQPFRMSCPHSSSSVSRLWRWFLMAAVSPLPVPILSCWLALLVLPLGLPRRPNASPAPPPYVPIYR